MTFWKTVPKVLAAHALLIAVLLLVPLLQECRWFSQPDPHVIEVSLADLAQAPSPPKPEPDPEPPEEDVQPVTTPVPTPRPTAAPTPAPTATPRPRPTPTPTPKPRYRTPEEIRARIAEPSTPVDPAPAAPTLTPREIQALISDGLPSTRGVSGGGAASGTVDFGSVEDELYRRLYSAWVQPRHLGASPGTTATAEVTVARDGRIRSSRLIRRSGIAEFDQSVEQALESVSFAKPLPEDYDGDERVFQFQFELSP